MINSNIKKIANQITNLILNFIRELFKKTSKHHIFLLGGGLTFSILICIFPFILIIFSILGKLLEDVYLVNRIELFISELIPYQDYAQNITEIIKQRIEEIRNYKSIAGYLGILGLFITSSNLFSNMRTILNLVFHTENRKNIFIGKLRDLTMIFVVLLFFLVSTTILPGIEILKELSENNNFLVFLRLNQLLNFIMTFASFAIVFSLFFTLYYFVPYENLAKRVVGISSLTAASLWIIAAKLFGIYISHFASLKEIYGTYIFIIVIAFWIYYSSLVFIIGAETGQIYREYKQPVS